MMMAKQPDQHSHNHPKPNTIAWYFFEFWPIMVFGTCFVLMMAIPLFLSGSFAASDVFSSSDSVWAPYGLLILAAFLMAWLVTFIAPWAMGIYVFALGVYALILVENVTAMNWGWTLAVLFLVFMLFGNLIFGNIYEDASKKKGPPH